MKTEAWIKWRKLKKKQCCLDFREELRQNLGGKESTSEVVRKLVFGVSFGQRKGDKDLEVRRRITGKYSKEEVSKIK